MARSYRIPTHAALAASARSAELVGLTAFSLGSSDDYRIPDHGYARELSAQTFVPTAAIVVEILSPDDERWAEQAFYVAHGVGEVLVVDPKARIVQWFGRGDDGFEPLPGSRLLRLAGDQLASGIDWPVLED